MDIDKQDPPPKVEATMEPIMDVVKEDPLPKVEATMKPIIDVVKEDPLPKVEDKMSTKMEESSEPSKPIEPIPVNTIKINVPKGTYDMLVLFYKPSITQFIKSSIPQLRDIRVEDIDSIADRMKITPDVINSISQLLLKTELLPDLDTFEQFINTHLPNYFQLVQLGAENKVIFYPSGDNPNHNFNAQIIGTHLLPTRKNITLLLALYLLYISQIKFHEINHDFISNYIDKFNRFFLNYYDPTDHTRELLVDAKSGDRPSQVVLAKYINPQVFHDVINSDFYFKFLDVHKKDRHKNQKKNYNMTRLHNLGIFKMEYYIDPAGTHNMKFSIVNDNMREKLSLMNIEARVPFMTILEWYAKHPDFRYFLDKVFEKTLFDFCIFLKLKTKSDFLNLFNPRKVYFSVDMYYDRPTSMFGWHQDQNYVFEVERFTVTFIDKKSTSDTTARTGKYEDAFIGTGVGYIAKKDSTKTSGYFAASNGITLGINNKLLMHTTPDIDYDLSTLEKSTKNTFFYPPLGEPIDFTEDRGGRLTTQVQQYTAKLLSQNTFGNIDTTPPQPRSFMRTWFFPTINARKYTVKKTSKDKKTSKVKKISKSINVPHSDTWKELDNSLAEKSSHEHYLNLEGFNEVSQANRDDYDLVTLRKCVLNTKTTENDKPLLKSVVGETTVPSLKAKRPREEEEEELLNAKRPREEEDIIDIICSLVDKVDKSAIHKTAKTIADLSIILKSTGMGKKKSRKSKKHKTRKTRKTKKSRKSKT